MESLELMCDMPRWNEFLLPEKADTGMTDN